MSANAMRFKARIRELAKEEGVPAQVVLQNFMFERFFARLCKLPIRENLILKGGTLISQHLGISRRTTMDIDVTLRNAALTEETIAGMIGDVFAVDLGDGVVWTLGSITPIRDDDQYGGFRVKIVATTDSIVVPFSIDISTGDAITPAPEDCFFRSLFDRNESYRLKAYTIETVVAEKIEAILSLGTTSTRPRDYYDAYMLTTVARHSTERLKEAVLATAAHRNSRMNLAEWKSGLREIEGSEIMNLRWAKYQREFSFARGVSFSQICRHLSELMQRLGL